MSDPLTADDLARLRKNLFLAHSRDTRLYIEPADMLALLDMVAGYQQLVRLAVDPDDNLYFHDFDAEWRAWKDGEWHALTDAYPALAALLAAALEEGEAADG